MKTRSSIEMCAPAAIVAALCVLSVPTLIVALVWMTAGVCAVGYRSLEEFPVDRISWRWLRGSRRSVTHFYHLACWPRYVKTEVREFAFVVSRRIDVGHRIFQLSRRKANREGRVDPS
ncbi:protein of unknown function [Pararobbsia alpina]|uniref:hypothetical protein n=1 Tax=Pararobbsia alpina TaxID=621374 RepID=UPI0039A5D8F4